MAGVAVTLSFPCPDLKCFPNHPPPTLSLPTPGPFSPHLNLDWIWSSNISFFHDLSGFWHMSAKAIPPDSNSNSQVVYLNPATRPDSNHPCIQNSNNHLNIIYNHIVKNKSNLMSLHLHNTEENDLWSFGTIPSSESWYHVCSFFC
jgi:hypothetical protein